MSNTSGFSRHASKTRYPQLLPLLLLATVLVTFLCTSLAHSAQVNLAWDPSPSEVSGYRLYYGTNDGVYPDSADAQTSTTYALNLTQPTHYIVAKAYDGSGNESAPSNQVICHAITASAGSGGSISPGGDFYASEGSSQTFTITANAGYVVSNVLVNGVSVGAVSSHTITSVSEPLIVSASFSVVPPANQAPAANAGADQTVNEGQTVTLNGSGSSDPEGAGLSYRWTQTAG
ncbi:MAG: hypothetical protein HGB14_09350, partial [Anaerolineaceae bacterium]|nr:hypothetical protein [Anaerolineaceae bacterium]